MGTTEGRTNRGQAHVLEGVAAAILILASVTFALQMTAVTPLTASTSNQHLQTQAAGAGSGALIGAAENHSLERTVRYWNESEDEFHGVGESGYYESSIPTPFGETLESTLGDAGLVYNVNLQYVARDGTHRVRTLLNQGEPSDHAVSVTRTVILYDDDQLLDASGSDRDRTLEETEGYFAKDAIEGPVYNVVRVEVVAWRV